ncbi:MAG: hypothetical protein K9G62_07205, partial [Alphaproteobacteria bacterium]|nr:hypothetical protein [Alphaproteobacteria bacterium]
KPNQGGIEIWNEEEKSLLSESASAHFLAFSYGPNGAGGYTIEGTRFPCPVDGYEHENCNQETDSVYQIAAFSTESHLPFDDVFSYSTQDEIPLWKLSEDPGHTMDIHQIPLGNVGIFTAPTTPLQAEGHIQGVLRAQDDPVSGAAEGMAMATQICMENGAECFPSSAIAGQLAESEGMECPPGEFISAIKNAAPVCIPEVIISCPAGEFATGLTDDGTLLCTGSTPTGPTTCPAQTVDVCGKLVNIPAGNEGDIYKAGTPMTIDATTSATIQTYKTYVCSSGSWVYSPSPTDGTCTCTTGSTTAIVPCGPGYSGSKSQTYNAACPSYTSTYTINAVACACKQETETKHEDCPPGYTGSGITMARDHLCPSVSPVAIPTWTDWYQIDASTDCTCTPDSKDVVKACPNGESGEIHEKWVLECPSGAWTFYSEISNTCVGCVDTTEIRTNTCPAGETGVIEEEWAYSCATDTWTLVQETSNTCTIPVCHWTPISTPQGPYPHPSGSLEYSKCTCGAPDEQCYRHAGTQYEHFPACQCQ